jgi:hypothetical protein
VTVQPFLELTSLGQDRHLKCLNLVVVDHKFYAAPLWAWLAPAGSSLQSSAVPKARGTRGSQGLWRKGHKHRLGATQT